ncbi:MAG: glycosyltransferase family 4 protein [Sterolibacteriaceae bacterium]|nr:glycosyltransferase family 4 protein [Candidatus Methylophosphatis haderslevensis]
MVDVFDLDLRGITKACVALATFSPDRRRWGNRLHQNAWSFDIRTASARRALEGLDRDFDLIFQDGAMFHPPLDIGRPFVSYHDSNVVLAAKAGELSQGAHYGGGALRRAIARERRVYNSASLVFTMSDWLKDSLIADFGVAAEKIVTVYAGTNLPVQDFEKEYDGKTVLFVGRNFERKGGAVLLEAFRRVRKNIAGAKLIVVGPDTTQNEDGVEFVGRVTDKQQLAAYFRQASIFAMPSFYEPFGIVFAEAFAYKTPCIGSDTCAMPEIIGDGEGGFVVPVGDSAALADRIMKLLGDRELARRMGEFGNRRARERFNWDSVVAKMVFHFTRLVDSNENQRMSNAENANDLA